MDIKIINKLNHHLNEINHLNTILNTPFKNLKPNIELENLKNYLLNVIYNNQNPKNCTDAKFVICPIKNCGFGCNLHHYFHCFNYALYSNRVLYFEFEKIKKYKKILKPSSDTCIPPILNYDDPNLFIQDYNKNNKNAKIVQFPIIDNQPQEEYFPMSIPKELIKTLIKYHEFPFIWYCGVVQKYILRLTNNAKYKMNNINNFLKNKPVVGVHIRRTDKLKTEASSFEVEKYFEKVDNFFERISINNRNVVKKIFLCTDEPEVIKEVLKKYPSPEYDIFYTQNNVDNAQVSKRDSEEGQLGIILDILGLSKTDYLVCTFSSQVCRAAYELMNSGNVDKSDRYYTIDSPYYYGGSQNSDYNVIHSSYNKKNNFLNDMDIQKGNTLNNLEFINNDHFMTKTINNHNNSIPTYLLRRNIQTVKYKAFKTPFV